MNLKICKVYDLDEKEIERLDRFIGDPRTNGEFINTVRYLSYHAPGRFLDDSVFLRDTDCGEIKGVMMAAALPENPGRIISHPGTTFAGPVFQRRSSAGERLDAVEQLLSYYESRYREVCLKTTPSCYCGQPMELSDFFLLRRGYRYGMSAMANVIDLRKLSEEQCMESYTAGRRNHIKKALRGGRFRVRREDAVSPDAWRSLEENLLQKFGGRPTHSYEEISCLRERFPDQILPYTAYSEEGRYGAFALVYRFKHVFHTQYLDMNYQYSSEYPNLLLLHELETLALREGYSYFSFGASTEERGEYLNEGLFNYKAGFGGGEILLPMYEKMEGDHDADRGKG